MGAPFLAGFARSGDFDFCCAGFRYPEPMTPRFVEGTGVSMNAIPPNDYSFHEMLNDFVQEQPAESFDPEIAASFAAIGIVKDKPFSLTLG